MKRALLALTIAAMTSGCPSSNSSSTTPEKSADAPTGPAWFEDVTLTSGVDFRHFVARERHYYMPETVTGGVALLDYDGDGDLDLYFVQGGDLDELGALGGNRLYRNDGSAKFEDVTDEAGVGDLGYGMGCAVGDYDQDGDPDLFVANVGPNVFYRNEGDGTFTNVSEAAGVADPGHGSSCAFGDADGDGDLDLFVVNYIQWSKETELECVV